MENEQFNHVSHDSYWHNRFGHSTGAVIATIIEILQILIISAAIVIPIRYFLIQPFRVKGASMEPNYFNNEYLIIDEISYRFNEPVRGEIVVFRYPKDPSQFFIKRVVGLPGETVEVTQEHVVIYNSDYPNGMVLAESYIPKDITHGKKKITLAIDEYFVLGDNREESLDSRSFGEINRNKIIGKVWIRGLPISRADIFDLPEYNF
ncbi:MAG: signal peptidase I [Patescibacteria group bacterium]